MKLELNKGISLNWGTPLQVLNMPGSESVNAQLKALILERKRSSEGITKSNLGGWHSTDDLLTWPSPAAVTLRDWILQALQKITKTTGRGEGYNGKVQITCWANVNGAGHSNDLHNHPQCAWSGVYYVDVGTPVPDEEKSGFIHFIDPRNGAGMVEDPFHQFGKGREFKPLPGQMLLFPSWLLHGVRAYCGEGERISIAFNIVLLELT